MKKKLIIIATVAIVLIVLFVPIPGDVDGHGDTKVYNAIAYRIVKWDKPLDYAAEETQNYKNTKVYIFADRYKPMEKLWYEELRNVEYTDEWLDKSTAKPTGYPYNRAYTIKAIYSNCFFVQCGTEETRIYKINGEISGRWCVGDKVICTMKNEYRGVARNGNGTIEGELVEIEDYDTGNLVDKPVLYLYPEEETEVSVQLDINGELTCTYPKYNDGWKVTAKPDGTLTDSKGLEYNYLYWEAKSDVEFDMSKGFCIKGKDTAKFLEEALKKLGLNRKEANEFIIYWLPMMENNPYNIISFQTDVYTDMAKLDIEPAPDTLIRVFMTWSPSDEYVEMEEQELSAPSREGFCVVEWGGTKIK